MKFSATLLSLVFSAASASAAAVGGGAGEARAIAPDGILARSASPALDAHTNNLLPRDDNQAPYWTLWTGEGEITVTTIFPNTTDPTIDPTYPTLEELHEKCKYPGDSAHGWQPKDDGFAALLMPGVAAWFKDDTKTENRCITGFHWAMKLAADGDEGHDRLLDIAGNGMSVKIAYPSGASWWEPEKRFYRFISSSS